MFKLKSGYTLVELLVVITIIGILISTSVPSLINFIEEAKTDATIEELSLDLHNSKTTAISSNEDILFSITQNSGVYSWALTQSTETIKKYTLNDNNLSIFFNNAKLNFSPLGFLQDENGNQLSETKITICNIVAGYGKTIIINSFGKIELTEGLC